ncbi:cache domain-containing protein [Kozakia baliensis]|uniref:cache domain-containing protein n=1 Tax=Kozakia baliensis TaxID=153496 RepID=UPI00087A9083|nr:adenylate/guanylate cyclase domain-containing protein [Kozakia baliensis]AOX20131.1 hypothetical protein A0U90_07345 [Kozakia baliensis]
MPVDEIVDPANVNAGQRRRQLLEVGGPILSVLLVIVVIIGISLHSYHSTRQGVIALSQDLLKEQQQRITLEVSNYLMPAPATAVVARDLLSDPVTNAPPKTFLAYGGSMLRNVQQIESFYLADDRGSFWFIDRAPADIPGGMEWVHLEHDQDVFRHWYYDKNNHLVRTSDVPADHYDPRQRPWFKTAFDHPDLNWADPYPTRSTKQLVVTATTVFHSTDGHQSVFAINISLNELTNFLGSMKIGRSGRAVVVDKEGHLVAGSDLLKVAQSAGWDYSKMLLNPDTQPVFVRALALFHIYGSGARLIKAHDINYVTIMASLHRMHPGWVLMLNAPENDFAAFTMATGRQGLLFSLLIVLLAAALAGFLVRQSQRSERLRRLLEQHRAETIAENHALNEIAGQENLFDATHDAPILTQRLAKLAQARRVSLWRFVGDRNRLLCEDAYDQDSDAHSTGLELSHQELAPFFSLIQSGETVDIADAAQDDRLRIFQRIVMRSFGSRSVYLRPIQMRGDVVGAVVLEDAHRAPNVAHIIAMVAEIAAIRFAASGDANQALAGAHALQAPSGDVQVHFEEGFLAAAGDQNDGGFTPGRYPMVPIATILFQDNTTDNPVDVLPVVQDLTEKLQDIARTHQLFSVQILGNRIVLVGGCSKEPDPGAAQRLADAILALREVGLITLSNADLTPSFRIGLDVGTALGAVLGHDPGTFNLWGEAAQTSELLAESAPDAGTIQVSEAAYSLLREYYLFRPRGMFYLPRLGVTRTFVLAAKR